MRVPLKPFQQRAVAALERDLDAARAALHERPQAVVLSAPTGSGKTVALAALLERRLLAEPRTCVLWFSDSPSLNEQSRARLASVTSQLGPDALLTLDATFDAPRLPPGRVCFLNTQKLAVRSLLTRAGDRRRHTIWQTIARTAAEAPGRFLLVIDEAHRGMTRPRDLDAARTLVQRFLLGGDELPPVPLILGMSATPARFLSLVGDSGRAVRTTEIPVADVRASGLLKDRLILADDDASPTALLERAATAWRTYRERWRLYCHAARTPLVRPMLVIQVEDGDGQTPTRTDLDALVATLRHVEPRLEGRVCHCFQHDQALDVAGLRIPRVAPHRLAGHPSADVALFKTALTTGWDCPRAEVVMSFRRAVDPTVITQLVGRLVRAPLARRVEVDARLDAVELFLPRYESGALERVVTALTAPDATHGVPLDVARAAELQTLPRAAGTEVIFARLAQLPSYLIGRGPRGSWARRLLRLARRLTALDGLDLEALDEARATVVDAIAAARPAGGSSSAPPAPGSLAGRQLTFDWGDDDDGPLTGAALAAAATRAGERLAAGQGLTVAYRRAHHDPANPDRARRDLIAVAADPAGRAAVESAARARFRVLLARNAAALRALPVDRQQAYRRIVGSGPEPAPFGLAFPDSVQLRAGDAARARHLYADDAGRARVALDAWQADAVDRALASDDVVGWLRNAPGAPWTLVVPYEDGDAVRPFAPELLVLRRSAAGGLLVDLLTRADAPQRLGLARYCREHGDQFARVLCQTDGEPEDLNDASTRDALLARGAA